MHVAWVICCAIVAAPLIINPDKVIQRPGCKIKSPTVLRILGIAVILISILQLILHII